MKIGKVSDIAIVDMSGSAVFNFSEYVNESEVACVIDAISSSREKAYIEIDGKVYTADLTGMASRNALAAFDWAHATDGVLEISL